MGVKRLFVVVVVVGIDTVVGIDDSFVLSVSAAGVEQMQQPHLRHLQGAELLL